jgi:hypothetical protein
VMWTKVEFCGIQWCTDIQLQPNTTEIGLNLPLPKYFKATVTNLWYKDF